MKKCIFVLLMLFGFLLVVTLAAPVTESEKLDENQGSLMIRQDEEEPMELEELDDEEDVLDDEETLEDDMERYPRYGGYGKRHGGYGYGGKYRDYGYGGYGKHRGYKHGYGNHYGRYGKHYGGYGKHYGGYGKHYGHKRYY
uniref:Glycine-rich protein n=1 Tax=Timspurckia oligopyrenoides TaxID=708627 RepID=A0A7S0ZF14_9RHOD|mmetsp:Transcript_2756/g.4847  ORF Transcript_2756/g.4847 Transcript_2756/m.4847 type:complete len:141 (+) Transcript_2756:966-1388(+)